MSTSFVHFITIKGFSIDQLNDIDIILKDGWGDLTVESDMNTREIYLDLDNDWDISECITLQDIYNRIMSRIKYYGWGGGGGGPEFEISEDLRIILRS
ncbi:MAG: hypothetical protein PHG66_04620 [Candidatus Colwellbacteria bacterium]|nr:hypothetical protein [Candidatus Colwellbacteria bacterium]